MIDIVLVNYETGKNAHNNKLKVQDKIFKTKETVYLNIDSFKINQKLFKESIVPFEQFLGKDFWGE